VGSSLLVRSVFRPLAEQPDSDVYLPSSSAAQGWYNFASGTFFAPGHYKLPLDMDGIPAFWRAGSIIPTKQRLRRSSTAMLSDPLVLLVFVDITTNSANGAIYIDDGVSRHFTEGNFLACELAFSSDGVLQQTASRGDLWLDTDAAVSTRVEQFEFYGLSTSPSSAVLEVKGRKPQVLQVAVRQLDQREPESALGSRPTLFAASVKDLELDLKDGTAWRLRLGDAEQSFNGNPPVTAATPAWGQLDTQRDRRRGSGHIHKAKAVASRQPALATTRPLGPCLIVGVMAKMLRTNPLVRR